MDFNLTFDWLPVVSVVLSLLAWYVPRFKEWYQALSPEAKQGVMALLIFLIAAVASLLSWLGVIDVYSTADGWKGLILAPIIDFVIALIANAGFYKGTQYLLGPKSK